MSEPSITLTPVPKNSLAPDHWEAKQPLGGSWIAVAEIRSSGGRPLLTGIRIEPEHPKHGAPADPPTARQLRGLSPDRILREAARQLGELTGPHQIAALGTGFNLAELGAASGRRRPHGDLFYARWAAAYLNAWSTGRGAVGDLAKAAGIERRAYIYEVLAEARRRGLLIDGSAGRGGGNLTPKAIEILEAQDAKHPTP